MTLWFRAHHIGIVGLALTGTICAEVLLGEFYVGIPAFIYFDTSVALSLMAAIPLIVAIAIIFDGNEPNIGIPLRNTVQYDYISFFVIVAVLLISGVALTPRLGGAGICMALTILGCGSLGIICSRLFGRKTGGAVAPIYIVICCLVGTPPMQEPLPWQFPLSVSPMPSQILVVLGLTLAMIMTPAHPERRTA